MFANNFEIISYLRFSLRILKLFSSAIVNYFFYFLIQFRSWNDLVTNKKYLDEFENLLLYYKNPVDSILDISQKSNFMGIQKSPRKGNYQKSTVSWIASHCSTQSNREAYIEEIKNYIYVDSYGNCGDRHDPCRELPNKRQKVSLMKHYFSNLSLSTIISFFKSQNVAMRFSIRINSISHLRTPSARTM